MSYFPTKFAFYCSKEIGLNLLFLICLGKWHTGVLLGGISHFITLAHLSYFPTTFAFYCSKAIGLNLLFLICLGKWHTEVLLGGISLQLVFMGLPGFVLSLSTVNTDSVYVCGWLWASLCLGLRPADVNCSRLWPKILPCCGCVPS